MFSGKIQGALRVVGVRIVAGQVLVNVVLDIMDVHPVHADEIPRLPGILSRYIKGTVLVMNDVSMPWRLARIAGHCAGVENRCIKLRDNILRQGMPVPGKVLRSLIGDVEDRAEDQPRPDIVVMQTLDQLIEQGISIDQPALRAGIDSSYELAIFVNRHDSEDDAAHIRALRTALLKLSAEILME